MTDRQAKQRTMELFAEWRRKLPEKFANFAFPIIRNMAANDLIADLVAVQPMAGPSVSMFSPFYMDIVGNRVRSTPWWKRLLQEIYWSAMVFYWKHIQHRRWARHL